LWVRDLTSGKAALIPGTQGAAFPFWSPDSNMIGFFSNGKMRTVAAAGGPVQIICDAPAGRGGAWSPAGMIVFTPNIEEPLYKVGESGGTPLAVTKLGGTGHTHRNPIFLPDGKHFLFTQRLVAAAVGDLYAGSLDGSEPKLVVQQASNGVYAQGYLLYLHDRNLMAQRFDPRSMTVSGNPVPVAENVEYWGPKDLGNFSVSATGTLVYRTEQSTESRFAWMKLPGKESEEFGDTIRGVINPISVSADASKIAFAKRDGNSPDTDLWLYDVDRKIMARQTFNVRGFIYSAFSPDGAKLAITSSIGTQGSMRIKTLATGEERPMTSQIQDIAYIHSWTPDGKYLIVSVQDPKTLFDIYAQPVEGGKPIPLLTQSYDERDGEVSPNGKWMAYISNESGRIEVYITDFPGAHSKMQVSSEGAFWHAWSHDGKRLYFANGKKLMATEIRNPETMELGGTAMVTMLDAQPLAFGKDGRLLVLKSANGQQTEPLRMVLHFPESLGK
ncbi:MAG: hypothetical protein WAN70_19560, partial [Terriglobales bacterium]